MKTTIHLFASIVLMIVLGACAPVIGSSTPTPVRDGNIVVVKPVFDGPNMASLSVGQVLVVQIPTIPQEGFEWVLADCDPTILVSEGEGSYIEDADTDSAGGVVEFRFAVVGSGETNLSFDYRDEAQGVSSNTFGLTVTVSDGSENIVVVTPDPTGPQMAALKLGDVLVVQIPTIPQEGFEWVLADCDPTILVSEGEGSYIEDADTDSAGGVVEFRFAVVGSGETNLSFDYRDEAEGVSSNSYGLTVTVSDGSQDIVVVTPDPTGPQMATLKVGDVLVIELPTIPEEGFQWYVQDVDTTILSQVGEAEYNEDAAADSAGGVTRLQFEAVGAGETSLALEYTKMSEETSDVVTRYSFGMTVVVE